jgi:hypothetical protein
MNRKLFLLPFLILTLSSCMLYKINSDETSLDFYEPNTSAKEVVYLEEASPTQEVIGTVVINTERRTDREEVIIKAKREAARLGGDAITNLREEPPTGKGKHMKNAYIRTNYRADVLNLGTVPETKASL